MYPQSERNNLIGMSPVCIVIDVIKTTRRNSNPEDSGDEKEKTKADAGEDDEGASWTIHSGILHPSLQVYISTKYSFSIEYDTYRRSMHQGSTL
jgi:hypothetical protein